MYESGECVFFTEPCDAHGIREVGVLFQPCDSKGGEVSFTDPWGTDEEDVVLVIGRHADGEAVEDLLEQSFALNEDLIQQIRRHIGGSIWVDTGDVVHEGSP
ncbi:MAG: hypothetical protein RL215_2580 [Planctomycetota bacterium]